MKWELQHFCLRKWLKKCIIHSFIFHNSLSLWGRAGTNHRREVGYTHDKSPFHHRAEIEMVNQILNVKFCRLINQLIFSSGQTSYILDIFSWVSFSFMHLKQLNQFYSWVWIPTCQETRTYVGVCHWFVSNDANDPNVGNGCCPAGLYFEWVSTNHVEERYKKVDRRGGGELYVSPQKRPKKKTGLKKVCQENLTVWD